MTRNSCAVHAHLVKSTKTATKNKQNRKNMKNKMLNGTRGDNEKDERIMYKHRTVHRKSVLNFFKISRYKWICCHLMSSVVVTSCVSPYLYWNANHEFHGFARTIFKHLTWNGVWSILTMTFHFFLSLSLCLIVLCIFSIAFSLHRRCTVSISNAWFLTTHTYKDTHIPCVLFV